MSGATSQQDAREPISKTETDRKKEIDGYRRRNGAGKNIIEKRRRKGIARTEGSRDRNMGAVERKKDREHVAIVTALRSETRCCSCAKYTWKGTHKESKKIKS